MDTSQLKSYLHAARHPRTPQHLLQHLPQLTPILLIAFVIIVSLEIRTTIAFPVSSELLSRTWNPDRSSSVQLWVNQGLHVPELVLYPERDIWSILLSTLLMSRVILCVIVLGFGTSNWHIVQEIRLPLFFFCQRSPPAQAIFIDFLTSPPSILFLMSLIPIFSCLSSSH
ncbi:hypothetical protein VTN77DRAFT_3438 [Rasamsonia byssochlamydoides]|uniref:uncharacterized protein n=1 Tax=Rasamsonia byssochlamydoides TaxID=89139 RepID=UPI003743E949